MTSKIDRREKAMANETSRKNDQPEKRDAPRMTFLFKCLLAAMLLLSFTFFLTYLMKTNQLLRDKDKIDSEITERGEHVEELRYLIDSPVDDAYIIRVAREKLGLVFPDEEIFYQEIVPGMKGE